MIKARVRITLLCLAASLVAGIGADVWYPTLREKWISTRSLDELGRMSAGADSDPLVSYTYAARLAESGRQVQAWPIAKRAVDSLIDRQTGTSQRLAGRFFALAGYLAAEVGEVGEADTYLRLVGDDKQAAGLVELGRGVLSSRSSHWANAVRHLKEAVRQEPGLRQAWTYLGDSYLRVSLPSDALIAFRRASSLNPQDPKGHASVAEALGRLKQYTEATREARIAASLNPDDVQFAALPAISLASAARTETDYHGAVAEMEAASARFPGSEFLRLLIGGLHMRFNRFELARHELSQYLTRHPDDGPTLLNLADVCERLGDATAARANRERFVRLSEAGLKLVDLRREALTHPDDAGVFVRLHLALAGARRSQEALRALNRAAELRPQDKWIATMLSTARRGAVSQPGELPRDSEALPH